jgi:hypothetical protein
MRFPRCAERAVVVVRPDVSAKFGCIFRISRDFRVNLALRQENLLFRQASTAFQYPHAPKHLEGDRESRLEHSNDVLAFLSVLVISATEEFQNRKIARLEKLH